MVESHVGFEEHLLFFDSFFPSIDTVLENFELLLIPASVLGLISLRASFEDLAKELPRTTFRKPFAFEELDQSIPALELLHSIHPVLVPEQAS